VGPAVFKTVVGGEEPPGCVRFAHASAISYMQLAPLVGKPGSRALPPLSRSIEGVFMRGRLVVAAALIGALSFATTGCDRLAEKMRPQPTIITREATVAVAAAAVEGAFQSPAPEGLPLWPTARVVQPENRTQGSKSWDEMLLAADTFDVVLAGMVTGLEKGGWQVETIDASVPGARTSILNVTGTGGEGVITIAETPEGTTIGYVIAPPR
jgi:hypothetical protein